jgi:hypothetical protein
MIAGYAKSVTIARSRMNEPKVGDVYTTHKNKVTGIVVETVPNRTGSIRVRLITTSLETRWTTWVPEFSHQP